MVINLVNRFYTSTSHVSTEKEELHVVDYSIKYRPDKNKPPSKYALILNLKLQDGTVLKLHGNNLCKSNELKDNKERIERYLNSNNCTIELETRKSTGSVFRIMVFEERPDGSRYVEEL